MLKKDESRYQRQVELPTLIDMVFLLLVFFIATLHLSAGGDPKSTSPDQQQRFDLPEAMGTSLKTENGVLSTLLFQIQRVDSENPQSPKMLYVLQPDHDGSQSEADIMMAIREELAQEPPDSNHVAVFPRNYLQMSYAAQDTCRAFRLIRESIASYQDEHFAQASFSNTIEIRAIKDTEFRIISYILQECSEYDDLIPKVTFRVMSPEEIHEE